MIEERTGEINLLGLYIAFCVTISAVCSLYISVVMYKNKGQDNQLNVQQQSQSNTKFLSNVSNSITGLFSLMLAFAQVFFLSSFSTLVFHTIFASIVDLIPVFLVLCVAKVFSYVKRKINDSFN